MVISQYSQRINYETSTRLFYTFTDPRYWRWLYDMEMNLDKTFRFYFITFGMIYQTRIIIEITTKVVIG